MANKGSKLLVLSLLVLLSSIGIRAQSLDPSKPSPIRSSTLTGHIAARDLGDARLTDHYYRFSGTLGDLLITVRSQNLNGDLDVFTAVGMRPLLKVTLYAESANPITKGIYLRKREDLILRVEARSPNDDEGTYQLFFGGSFLPVIGEPDEDEASTNETPAVSSNRRGKRVSSVGARLPEPEPTPSEVAAAPTPEPTPEATPAEKVTKTESEKPTAAPKTTRTPPRTRRSTTRRSPSIATTKPKETETATAEEPKNNEEEVSEKPEAPKTRPATRTTTRRGTSAARSTKPEPPPSEATEPESGPRLVIETNDGTLINRSMSTIRRVIVENGQVVITGKDGKIDRILLVNVVRMSIAP